MYSGGVIDVHNSLGYTQADEDSLKKVRNVWRKLETLRAKASKNDPAALRAYREFLEKSLVAARQTQTVPDPVQAHTEFWAWYLQRCEDLGVPEFEGRRGRTHQAWMERWHKGKYTLWEAAVQRIIDEPTPGNFLEARNASEKMLRTYVEAFKDH